MEKTQTPRGFDIYEFIDRYGYLCSLQKSSLATEDCIWLGVNDAVNPEARSGRMHLTQKQVRELLPILQRFVETGEI